MDFHTKLKWKWLEIFGWGLTDSGNYTYFELLRVFVFSPKWSINASNGRRDELDNIQCYKFYQQLGFFGAARLFQLGATIGKKWVSSKWPHQSDGVEMANKMYFFGIGELGTTDEISTFINAAK